MTNKERLAAAVRNHKRLQRDLRAAKSQDKKMAIDLVIKESVIFIENLQAIVAEES